MLQGKKLIFEDDTLGVIADFALNRGYGARGLRHVLGKIMENVLFESPTDLDTNTYIITTDYVRDKVYTLDKRFIEISSIVRECIYDIREHLNLQENSFAYNNDMVEEIATVFYKEDIGCDRILEIMSSHKIINDKVVKYGFAEDEMYEKLNEYIIENIKK